MTQGTRRVEQIPVRRVLLLVNPVAARGAALDAGEAAAVSLRRRGIEVEIHFGADREDTRAAAVAGAADPEIDSLVACGGDGLIALVADAVAGTGTPVGIVPAGTGNDLARELGLHGAGSERAAEVVAAGRAETCDLGRVSTDDGWSRHFVNVLGAGFDGSVNLLYDRLRWPTGSTRYVVASALTLPFYSRRTYRLSFDGEEPIEARLLQATFGNTQRYGGGIRICPLADRSDGMLDATLISLDRVRSAIEFRRVFPGTHLGRPGVTYRRFRSVRVECPGADCYADGDRVPPLPITVEAAPGAARFLVP